MALINNGNASNVLDNISTTFNIGINQQPYNFYVLDNIQNNFVFECTVLDIAYALNTNPSFTSYSTVQSMGFTNVSQTATLDISASNLSGLFVFKPNPKIITNEFDITQTDNMLYGVSAEVFKTVIDSNQNYISKALSFSNANVSIVEQINNPNGTNTPYYITTKIPLYTDYINSLAYSITNGQSTGANLFANVNAMVADIKSLDAQLNIVLNKGIHDNKINTNSFNYTHITYVNGVLISNTANDVITNVGGIYYSSYYGQIYFDSTNKPYTHDYDNIFYDANENEYAMACKQLVTGILSVNSEARIQQALNDINSQVPPFKVIFHKGDVIALKIAYVPKNGNGSILPGLGSIYNNKNYTRTYKIFLNIVTDN